MSFKKVFLLIDLIIILIISLTPLLWFKTGCIINGPDTTYPLNPGGFFQARLFSWNAGLDTGAESAINLTTLFFHGLQAFVFWLGFSLSTTQMLTWIFWFLAICLSMYYFSCIIEKNTHHLQRLTMVIFYAFNPLLFNVWEASKAANLSALTAMPLILGLLIEGFERKISRVKSAFIIGLISIVVSEIGASPSVFAIPFILFTAYFIYFISISLKTHCGYKAFLNHVFFFFFVCLVYAIINLYWLLPYMHEIFTKLAAGHGAGLEAFNLANWLKDISIHTSLLNVSRFQGAWDWYYGWAGEPYVKYAELYLNNPFFLLLSLIIPIFAYAALFFRKDSKVVFFAALALTATVLSAGAHLPTGSIYIWITEHFPVLSIFRSPYYKFSSITIFCYAYLTSVTVFEIYKRGLKSEAFQTRIGSVKIFPAAVVGFIILADLIYSYPMLTGGIIPSPEKRFKHHMKVPAYIFESAQWLSLEKEDTFRIITLPQQKIDGYKWGYGSPVNLLNLLVDNGILWGDKTYATDNKVKEIFYKALYETTTPYASKILGLLNGKYALLQEDSWYDFYGESDSPEFIKSRLAYQKNFSEVISFGKWRFFRSETCLPRIYSSAKGFLVEGDADILPALADIGVLDEKPVLFFSNQLSREEIEKFISDGRISEIIFLNEQDNNVKPAVYSVSNLCESRLMLKELAQKYQTPYRFMLSSLKMDYEERQDKVQAMGLKIQELKGQNGFSETENFEGRRWHWMLFNKREEDAQRNESNKLIITNPLNEPVFVNLSFDIYSYKFPRRELYVYLNRKLFRHGDEICADTPVKMLLKNLRLEPGDNIVTFYTPHEWTLRNNIRLSFAFADFKLCTLNYKTEFQIPLAGKYGFNLYVYPLEQLKTKTFKDKIIKLDGEDVNLISDSGDSKLSAGEIFLKEGPHTFSFTQEEAEECFVEIKPQSENYTPHVQDDVLKFKRINPAKYEVSTTAKQPFFLVFLESYNSKWQAYNQRGQKISKHVNANGYANCWYVDENDCSQIYLEFYTQRLFNIGVWVSAAAIIFVLIFFVRLGKRVKS